MTTTEVVFWAGLTGLISAIATGLGALPVAFLPKASYQLSAFTSAFAAGMMISASVFSLAVKGIEMGEVGHATYRASAPYEVIAGLLVGGAFFWAVARWFGDHEEHGAQVSGLSGRGLLVFVGMFIHSIPEGVAIGVGFASGELDFGLLMALAISVHNVPEGIAISLPLHSDGQSLVRCAGWSILSSAPQPLLAVPAAWLVWLFQPLLPVGMGFAAGAMIYLVTLELIPDALEEGGATRTSWGVLTGLAAMLLLTTLLERWIPGA